ncbi:TPA: hypothetical protein ACIVT4_004295, partial [Salmonella enterica subsp. diarizonae serovar 61:l,v:z35]
MKIEKSEHWKWLMIPVMAVLVAAMYYIGYFGYSTYNWTFDTDSGLFARFTGGVVIGYFYIVYKSAVMALGVIAIQLIAFVLMLLLQGIHGLWIGDVFALSKGIFDYFSGALVIIEGAAVLILFITK